MTWLGKQQPPLTVYQFFKTKGPEMCQSTLYEHLRGENPNPQTKSLIAIEAATGGDVSVGEQLDWLLSRQA